MNILFTMCGRAGSKGFKNKNLKQFINHPLSYYTLAVIDLYINKYPSHQCTIAVNSDSEALIELLMQTNSKNLLSIERPAELAGDLVAKIDVIRHSLVVCEQRLNTTYDIIVDLDLTSPLRTLQDLENVITKKNNSESDVIFTVTNARRNPHFNMVKLVDHYAVKVIDSNYTARQQAPKVFDMNASIYAYSRDFLLGDQAMFEGKCQIVEMVDTGVLDIDSEDDFELMQIIGEYLINHHQNFGHIYEHITRLTE